MAAKTAISAEDIKVADVAELVESNFVLLRCTAGNDRTACQGN